jgi:hypothetical protein
MLLDGSDRYRWVAATVGANNAASYQLATGEPVMAIGGFNGSDPAPTLAQFQRFVADGEIHYFISAGPVRPAGIGGPPGPAGRTSGEIAAWVAAHFTPRDVDGVVLYDLTEPAANSSLGSSSGRDLV